MGLLKNLNQKIICQIALAAIFLFLFTPVCFSQNLPANGTVVGGDTQAQLDYSTPNELNVNVHVDKVITNWESFNVAAGHTVNFKRDSSFIALNRVTGSDPSSIFGNINATNGQIFLVNPNGIIFGSGSHVNAAGLVASTLDISNEDFMKGNYEFFKVAGKNGYIVNKGIISTSKPGGYICLFSQAIDNQGAAIADLGTIALASGEEITMSLDDKGIISVVVAKEVQSTIVDANGNRFDNAIKNSGTLQANGGKIILTAKVLNNVFDYAINNSGVIQAAALDEHDGVVELKANGAPIINTSTGTIEASGSIDITSEDSDIINEGGIKVEDITLATIDPDTVGPVIILDAGNDGTITNTGSIMVNGTIANVNGGRIALIAATVLQKGIVIANAYDGGTAGKVEIIARDSVVFGQNSTTAAACPFNIGNGGQIVVQSTNGSTSVLEGAVIDVSAGANEGNAGSLEIDAFDQLGFYGVLNGRAPPGYSAAKVTLRTTRPYDSALASVYALTLSGRISAQDISLSSNQGININGTILSSGIVTIDAQGPVQATGVLKAKTVLEHGASLLAGGTFEVETAFFDNLDGAVDFDTGNYSGLYYDTGNINILNGAVITLIGDTTFWADCKRTWHGGPGGHWDYADDDGIGSFSMGSGSSIVGQSYDLTIKSSQNGNLGSITGVGTLTIDKSKINTYLYRFIYNKRGGIYLRTR
ncbi:MAG: filamentous hemagglutinin N-terminal domain-containing protein [Candidatus Omnitrophota bacterium]